MDQLVNLLAYDDHVTAADTTIDTDCRLHSNIKVNVSAAKLI